MTAYKEVFIGYKFTWEDKNILNKNLWSISQALIDAWYNYFHSLHLEEYFRSQKMTPEQIYDFCENRLEKSDIFLAFINSQTPSKWMKQELEKAVEFKKKIILAIKTWLSWYDDYFEKAHKIIHFTTLSHLNQILKETNL